MKTVKGFWCLMMVIVCSTLVGCKSSDRIGLDPKKPITLKIWNYYHGPQQQAFDSMVSEFNASVGIEKGIVVESYSYGSVVDLSEAVLAAANQDIGAKDMPDMFATYSDDAIFLQEMGKLAELDDYLQPEELSVYVTSFLDEGRMGAENRPYIFPIAKSSEIGMLNKTDFDIFASEMKNQAIDISYEDLMTFEGIIKTAEHYYKWTDQQTPNIVNDGRAFFGLDVVANFINIAGKQMGKEIVNVHEGSATIGYDRETLRKIWDIYYVNMVKGYFIANGHFRSDDAKFGDLLYLVGATTGVAYFPTKVTDMAGDSHDVEMMAIKMPIVQGGEKVAVQQGAGMCVSKSNKTNEYASCLFLKWFTEEQRNIGFAIDSYGYMPVTKSASLDIAIQLQRESLLKSVEDPSRAQGQKNAALVAECFFDQFNEYELYMQRPFKNSAAFRNLLAQFSSYTKNAVEASRGEIEAGADYQETIDKYCSDEVFEAWYLDFNNGVTKLLN